MTQSIPAIDACKYILAGFHLRCLFWVQNTPAQSIRTDIEAAMIYLDSLGFSYPRTELSARHKEIEEHEKRHGATALPPNGFSDTLRKVADCVLDVVRNQAVSRNLVTLQTGSVSPKLKDLANQRRLNQTQTNLCDETVRCLETGAYRSAIVMGWNLIYDIFRRWVFDDQKRLADLNAELAKVVNHGQPKYKPIADYSDFYEGPGERLVLDSCKKAGVIGDRTWESFKVYLRDRNAYAHAEDRQPTQAQANAYIEHLIDCLAKIV
jgi:hypothetical protein